MTIKITFFLVIFFGAATLLSAQTPATNKLLFGVAYYYEYMPYERLDKDIKNDESCWQDTSKVRTMGRIDY